MKTTPILFLLGLLVVAAEAQAEVSPPRMLADRPSAHCQSPRWSPDGLNVAYDVYDPKKDTRETWIVSFTADGRKSGDKQVLAGSGRASGLLGGRKPPVVELEWAPDMKLLSKPYVFSSVGARKNFDLFADGDWLTTNMGNDGQPSWSRDGRFIAYASQRKMSGDIYVLDLGGDMEKPLQATFFSTATEFRPKWSPTKNYLLFTRSEEGSRGQDIGLVIDVTRPMDTTQDVTNWSGDEIRPSWSPDGRRVAFYSNKGRKSSEAKIFDLWVVDIDGQNARQLAKKVVVDDGNGPAWTPDGSTVLFVKQDFKRDNPVRWVKVDGSASGSLKTGTQLNSDLSLFARGEELFLAFKALGQKGSTEKTWERLFMVKFSMADLQADGK